MKFLWCNMTKVFSCPYDVFFGVHQIHEQGKIPKYEKVISKLLNRFYELHQSKEGFIEMTSVLWATGKTQCFKRNDSLNIKTSSQHTSERVGTWLPLCLFLFLQVEEAIPIAMMQWHASLLHQVPWDLKTVNCNFQLHGIYTRPQNGMTKLQGIVHFQVK